MAVPKGMLLCYLLPESIFGGPWGCCRRGALWQEPPDLQIPPCLPQVLHNNCSMSAFDYIAFYLYISVLLQTLVLVKLHQLFPFWRWEDEGKVA